MKKLRLLKGLSVALFASAMFVMPANALTLQLQSGVNVLTVNDGGIGDLDGVVNGSILSGPLTVGSATVSISTAFQSDASGFSKLVLNVTNAVAGIADLFVDVTHTGFGQAASAPNPTQVGFTMNASSISGGQLSGVGEVDAGNGAFVNGQTIGVAGAILNTTDTISQIDSAILANPFSMTILTTLAKGVSASYDATLVAPVPIPPALLLFGTSILGLGFLSRRRRKKAGAKMIAA